MTHLFFVSVTVISALLGCKTAGPASRIDRAKQLQDCKNKSTPECGNDSKLGSTDTGGMSFKSEIPESKPVDISKSDETPSQTSDDDEKSNPTPVPTPSANPIPAPVPAPPLVTCTINPKREWLIFSYFVVAPPEFFRKGSNTLTFPSDAVDFRIQVAGVYADDYSPKISINGNQVVNIVEPWRKSYASPLGGPDVSALLTPGANILAGEVTDITGTRGQHLGVGVCFSGTYKASKCGSPLEGPDAGYRCGR